MKNHTLAGDSLHTLDNRRAVRGLIQKSLQQHCFGCKRRFQYRNTILSKLEFNRRTWLTPSRSSETSQPGPSRSLFPLAHVAAAGSLRHTAVSPCALFPIVPSSQPLLRLFRSWWHGWDTSWKSACPTQTRPSYTADTHTRSNKDLDSPDAPDTHHQHRHHEHYATCHPV